MALLYWIHMLATVSWVGSIVALNLLVLPASKRTLKLADQVSFLSALQKRLEPVAWISIALLIITGLFQMSLNSHYNGYLNPSSQWSFAILIKHGLGVIMVVVSAIQTWEVFPAMQRVLMKKGKADQAELEKLNQSELRLLRINLWLAILILLATAFARAATP
jgi:uncharacterized membrane protein